MSQTISLRQATYVIIIGALVQFGFQVSLLTRGIEYVTASLVIDDTYYYLQTAWNTKLLGFVTFDGLHATNGVQMLWFVIILVLALLAKSKAVLLFTTLALNFLLNALCYLAIIKIGAALKQPALALLMASLWALQSLPFRIYSMGMENSLHALVFWCVLWQCVEFLLRVHNDEKPNFWGLTLVLILNAWTRLDSALLSVILFTFCVGTLAYRSRNDFKLFLENYGKAIAGSSLMAGLGLMVELAAFRLMGDSFLPVSALVKTSGAGRGGDLEPLEKMVRVFTLGMPSILQVRFSDLVLVLIGLMGAALVIFAALAIRDHSKEMRVFLKLWSCLLVGEVIYYVYVALSEVEYAPYFIWYRSPSFIFWIVTGSLLALFTLRLLTSQLSRPVRGLRWAPVGLSMVIFSVALYVFVKGIDFRSQLYVTRYNAALWMAKNSTPGTVFASWNAGQLGFFSDRNVINLDGVINSVDYYERVIIGPTSLTDYLLENNVEFVVDYDTYDSIPDLPVVQTFPINDGSGRSIYIWRVDPQGSSSS